MVTIEKHINNESMIDRFNNVQLDNKGIKANLFRFINDICEIFFIPYFCTKRLCFCQF